MIGPVGTPPLAGIGATHAVKLRPSGVEVPGKPATGKTPVAAELAAQGAPVDTSRVAELREAIAQGTYQIDSRRIADAMIASEIPAK